ncbi:type II toxin-antitoxin system VapC family toxin [Agrobacterium larrymoorei]|uniref:Ribonuclease VapC n=1 Tax=Agrobacterium larrymoorei TaxID=160699 RepID=A0A4D7DPK1_9HYPH|nr:type II toxin-antitoxin system VapC family toxin [Agrobacterium larrymoorei]QCI98481.1 type II toxin-antitoxin system VapC family toxin [Agrobacterium larrymoorei]QYA06056.1 type II toxin-antitoxin system VapC family toxin [Agrobacterium larrymoorei]
MIILDTNVISELFAKDPSTVVVEWVRHLPVHSVFTTTVTEAEILYGLRLLPEGRRRQQLEDTIQPVFSQDLAGRVLPFDREAADIYARIAVARRKIGKPISQFDAQIAAIAISHGASLATRNVSDFEELPLHVINPWA